MDGRMLAQEPGDPRRLGPYALLGRLGQGGMGVVFLGREPRGGRLAAVKALRSELAGDPTFAARFRREVNAARKVDAPSVARVLGADPSGPRPWLATEYVDGRTLAAEVAANGPLAADRLTEFATGVADALAAIHAAGVVHRDLKPSNVLLTFGAAPEATRRPGPVGVKVIDFGVASATDATVTRSGLRFGTPAWMAPEQLGDGPTGPAADVFAWGALVGFAATGRHPFGGGPSEAVAYRILHGQPDLAGVPEPLRRPVRDALSRDPAARPTAVRLAATLAAALPPTLPLPATDPTWVLPAAVAGGSGPFPSGADAVVARGPTRPRRRRRVGRLLAAAALLAGLVAAPQVVLAAAEGPGAPAGQHASRHCPEDQDDDEDAREERDDDDEDEDEEDAEEAAKRRDDRTPATRGAVSGASRPAGSTQAPPAPTRRPPSDPRPPSGNQVLRS